MCSRSVPRWRKRLPVPAAWHRLPVEPMLRPMLDPGAGHLHWHCCNPAAPDAAFRVFQRPLRTFMPLWAQSGRWRV